jgi:hypothetical protein
MSALWLALLFGFVNCGYAWDYGNGRHGTYVLTTNTTIEQLYQTIRLTNDPAQYNPTDSNAIPNFQNLIITNGATLTANAWNGSLGGTIFMKVEARLSVAVGSSISANGIGFNGGNSAGQQGQGPGGGAGGYFWYGNNILATGGSYGTPPITFDDNLLTTSYLGSGGGASEIGAYQTFGSGGAGGGIIALNVGSLDVEGQIQANGNNGGYGWSYSSWGGGGGSGGSILIRNSSASLGTNNVIASGGMGVNAGNGSSGRIMIGFAENIVGATTPAAYTLFDTNSDNITVITNQPATQTNFLAANVTFNVGAYGLPALMFQWNFNNAPIPGATNQSFSLNNIALTNTGNYSVTISNAVMTLVSSNAFLKVLDTAIPLGDDIPNWWKLQYGLSTNDSTLATNYPPGDKLTYLEKYLYGLNPLTNDTDGDGLTDYDEIFIYHTNPLLANTTGDGIPDGWKVQYGINPLIANATNEAGFDGVTYLQIYQ